MPVVILRLPEPKQLVKNRPMQCPYCQGAIMQRWGRAGGSEDCDQELYRYRCSDCGRTFREDIQDASRLTPSQRFQHLAGLAWLLGMSVRDVVDLFERYGHSFSRMTVWREGQRLAGLRRNSDEPSPQRYAIDTEYVHGASSRLGVVVALELEQGNLMVLGTVDERSPGVVKLWLEKMLAGDEISVGVMGTSMLDRFVGQPVSARQTVGVISGD